MLNLFCIILYTTFWLNHWLEAHKCSYLQNSIQDRCRNTEAVYKVYAETRKLLHKPEDAHAETRAATQSEDAYAETRSNYMVQGRRCWNWAVTHFRTDAETQWNRSMLKHEPWQSAVKADTVKGRNSRGWNSPWIAMLNSISSYVKKPLHQP